MTSIQWTDATWNPVTGCDKISPGCKHCYAEGIADRFFAKQYSPNPDGSPRKFTDVRCHADRLTQPRHWKQPRMVFVNSMSDLFHEDVPGQFIATAFAIMRECSRHTFQILTKRPDRMLRIVNWIRDSEVGPVSPNIWLGVSIENQKYANERIPLLLQTPAAIRFLSVEPMLEGIEFSKVVMGDGDGLDTLYNDGEDAGIDWVICGGESGPSARRFNLAWAEALLKQCQAAGVPFFLKQCGSNPFMHRQQSVEKSGPGFSLKIASLEYEQSIHFRDRKGGDMAEWPEHLRIREFPRTA